MASSWGSGRTISSQTPSRLWEATVHGGTGWTQFPWRPWRPRFRLPEGSGLGRCGGGLNDDAGTSALRVMAAMAGTAEMRSRRSRSSRDGWRIPLTATGMGS